MARPTKQGLDYFPFDVDFFQDLKIRKIIRSHGSSAPSILMCVLCLIYKENGYYIKWDEDTSFVISEILNCEEETVSHIIEKAIDVGFFNKDLYDKYTILTSNAIQKRFLLITKSAKLKRGDINKKYNLNIINSEETPINTEEISKTSEETPINTEESTQSKIKENKEKENKLSIEGEIFDFSSNPMLKPFSQSEINKIDLLKQDFNFDFLNDKDFFNGEIENEFLNWILYLKAFGKKLTQQMIQIQYSNLMRNSNNNKEKAINLINRSISKGWGDIYIEKTDIDFDINSIIGNSTNTEYIDFINYIEKYATFLNRMKEPLTEEQFIRLVKLKGLKTLKMIVVDLHNQQVYYEKLTNTFLTINKFIERNEKK